MNNQDYNYSLPGELIAHEPVEPRDAARLLVYSTETNEVAFDIFRNVSRYIPANSLLVLNNTRVVPARLELTKITGGIIRITFLFNEWNQDQEIKGLPDKEIKIGDILFFNHKKCVEVISQVKEEFTFRILIPWLEFQSLCDKYGQTPLPQYIHSSLNEGQARERYQSIFAASPASIAAPTASLHFTDNVFASLAEKGIKNAFVTLHVGRGTFSPVNAQMITEKRLHSEPIEISDETAKMVMDAKHKGNLIIPVGTTATRVLEASVNSLIQGQGYKGDTSLFITPPYKFTIVDGMITNFHLPNTSLIMLVDALLQSKKSKRTWKELYEIAIKEKFRFYSFGDVMLVI